MDDSPSKNYIPLEPFIHQVGGHSSLLCLDDVTICKPLVPRELQFYQNLPESLKKFTPNFYGVVEVHAVPQSDGYVNLFAIPPDSYQLQVQQDTVHDQKKIRFNLAGTIEVGGATTVLLEDQDDTASFDSSGSSVNPWVLKCHQTNLQNFVTNSQNNIAANFILIENLANNFSFPCILDLKMGTRQYGDTASLPKKQSKMFKVVSTTSGKLGVRIAGMQVYQVTSRKYICHNKFYGRKLSVAGFQQALCQFLFNGAKLRLDVLPPLIRRLEELIETLSSLDAVRLYTASLLLLYEGDACQPEREGEEAPVTFDSLLLGAPCYEEDLKRSCSAETLVEPFEVVPVVTDSRAQLRRRRSSAMLDDVGVASPKLNQSFRCVLPDEPPIDVRIIDFAHTTHDACDDQVTYSGPDQGFIFGLRSIVSLLKLMEREHG